MIFLSVDHGPPAHPFAKRRVPFWWGRGDLGKTDFSPDLQSCRICHVSWYTNMEEVGLGIASQNIDNVKDIVLVYMSYMHIYNMHMNIHTCINIYIHTWFHLYTYIQWYVYINNIYILIIYINNIYIDMYIFCTLKEKKHIKNWHWPCRSQVVPSTQPQLRWVPWGVDVFPWPCQLCCTGPMERWATGAMRCGARFVVLILNPDGFLWFPYTNHHKSMISCLLFSSCNTLFQGTCWQHFLGTSKMGTSQQSRGAADVLPQQGGFLKCGIPSHHWASISSNHLKWSNDLDDMGFPKL